MPQPDAAGAAAYGARVRAPARAGARSAPPSLPEAERRRRRRELWISAGVGAALAALFLLEPIAGLTQTVADSGLFLFLNAVVVILILLLGFLVTRNFWKLVAERRRGTLGSHLNLKFVSAFVLIAFVTASLLFAISAVIVTQSIDRWFGVQVDSALEKSGRIAERYYEATAQRALAARRPDRGADHGPRPAARAEPRRARRPDRDRAARLRPRRGRGLRRRHRELVERGQPGGALRPFRARHSELVRSALAGRAGWRVEHVGNGDVIRGAVPIASRRRPGHTSGALVFDYLRAGAAGPRRRHHPRDARAVSRAPAERGEHPHRLPARAAARLPGDPDARRPGWASASPRASPGRSASWRGPPPRWRAAISRWRSSRPPTTRWASWCAPSTA